MLQFLTFFIWPWCHLYLLQPLWCFRNPNERFVYPVRMRPMMMAMSNPMMVRSLMCGHIQWEWSNWLHHAAPGGWGNEDDGKRQIWRPRFSMSLLWSSRTEAHTLVVADTSVEIIDQCIVHRPPWCGLGTRCQFSAPHVAGMGEVHIHTSWCFQQSSPSCDAMRRWPWCWLVCSSDRFRTVISCDFQSLVQWCWM
jgi:hypothetical protein